MIEDAHWDRTELVQKRMRGKAFYEEKGIIRKEKIYKGRPVISRDTSINGGVYLGANERNDAIVVDDQDYPDLNKVFARFLQRYIEGNDHYKNNLLQEILEFTQEIIPYNQNSENTMSQQLKEADKKVSLTNYFYRGGACRHQALLAGYLLERLKREGFVKGRASIDRNTIQGKGGHAWIRYVNSSGEVYIIDPAQDYVGTLEEANVDADWSYGRPEKRTRVLDLWKKLKQKFTSLT